MTLHHDDAAPAEITSENEGASSVTVSSEAERRAHVADWIAKHHKSATAALGTAMLFLPAVAGAQTTPDSLVDGAGIDGVRDVRLLDDGSARFTLDNGRVMNVSADDVVIGDAGEVQVSGQVADILAEAAATPAAGGGAGGAIAAGAAAAVAGIAAASGGGGGGSEAPETQQVLNAQDVAGLTTFADIFGREPEGEPDRVIITVGREGSDPVILTDPEDRDPLTGAWTLPDDFAENFAGLDGEEVTVSFVAEQEVPPEEDENDSVDVTVEDGETLAPQTLADGAPEFEEVDSGSVTLLVDTVAPTIDIDTPIAGEDGVLNTAESGEDLTVTGTTTGAEDGQIVTLTVDGEAYTGTVSGGSWSVVIPAADLPDLPDGAEIPVEATVSDAAGNDADATATATFDTDFTAPIIDIDEVSGNDILTKANEANGVEISGTTDAEDGQDVTITFNGETYTATVAGGTWSVPVQAADLANLDTGDTPTISATVSDAAGNPAAAPATRDLDVDLTGPSLSIGSVSGDDIINIAESESDVTISGTSSGANGETVEVTIERTDATGTPTILDTTATADATTGDWSVTLDAATAGDLFDGGTFTVTANVTDFEGIAAPEATRDFTTDFTRPTIDINQPVAGDDDVINIAEQADGFTISGTTDAEDGQSVELSAIGLGIFTGVVSGGAWAINIPSGDLAGLADDSTLNLEATVSDLAGNVVANPAEATLTTDFGAPDITVDDLAGLMAGDELTAADLVDGQGDQLPALTVNGTSDALGQPVTVTIGTLEGTGTVDQNGDWSVDFTPADLGSELSGTATATINATVTDEAGNPGTGSLSLDVDLSLPEIAIDAPGDGSVLGLDAFEDGLDVSGTTTGVPDGQDVTIDIVDSTDSVVATITAPVADNAWSGSFDATEIAGLDDEGSFTLNARVNDGDFPVDATADIALSTDFAPELTVGEIGAEGVLILDEIDPNNVSVSGTTRGVEAGRAVTVALLDEGGTEIFTDDATVAADGTWSLDLPSATVESLEAGQTIDVQADVSNAAGRDAPQAQSQVVAYQAAQTYLVEDSANGTQVTMQLLLDPRTELPSDGFFSIGETVTFDTTEILYLDAPAPIYASSLSASKFTNDNDAASGEVVFGSITTSFDGSADFLVEFTMEQQTTNDIIQLDVITGDAGNYTSIFGTSAADTIAANNVDTVVRGRGGDDAVDLSGAGVNTVQFEAAPADNGFDTVTDFSIGGPLPDRLGFAGLNNADLRGDGGTFELLSGGSVGADTGLIVFTTAMTDLGAGSVQSAIDGLTGPADGDVLYFLASDGTDAQLYEVQVEDGDDTVTDMARFEGLGDLSAMTEANILGFDTSNAIT